MRSGGALRSSACGVLKENVWENVWRTSVTRAKTSVSTREPHRKSARPDSAEPRLSRLRHPAEMPIEDWQAGLRRQFDREQFFIVENLGAKPGFSESAVANPQSGGH